MSFISFGIEMSNIQLIKGYYENTLNITLNIDYLDNYTIELYDLKGVNLKEIFRGNLDLGDSNLFYNYSKNRG